MVDQPDQSQSLCDRNDIGRQQRLPVRTLSYLFAGLLVAIAVRMLLQ